MHRRDLLCGMLAGLPLLSARTSWGKSPFDIFRSQGPDKDARKGSDEGDEFDDLSTTVDTPMIGDYTSIAGLNVIEIQGVGLVTGLDGTGGDPPPSIYRTRLLDEMRRRGIANPNEILASSNTAMVLVRAYLPPLIRKGDTFDLDVRVPGNDESKSLNGGWLMDTYLTEEAIVPGQAPLKGHIFAKARGPILVSTAEISRDKVNPLLLRGKVLGGGVSLKDRDLSLYLRNDFRNVRNSKRISDKIGQRFFSYNSQGKREPLSEAKTDQKVELKLQERYKENFPRYLQVIRHIAFRETDVAERVRMQKLKERLLKPESSEKAALELEAIGQESLPVLKAALKSPLLEVRFHAAMSLAYQGEPDGITVLAEAAKDEPAFRVFAFAAMAAIDDAESHVELRQLMSQESPETRYGAFRALTTLDKNDPFIRGEKLNDQFMFHVLATEGPPMIHLTNRRKSEIVLFGGEQEFRSPMAVRAGTKILVTAAAGSEQVVVSRYEVGKPDRREIVSLRVADVIRKVCEFGASYPDVAQMLNQASRQRNTPGTIQIDSLPKAGLAYERPVLDADGTVRSRRQTRIGKVGNTPNIFSEDKDFNAAPKSRREEQPSDEATETGDGIVQAGAKSSEKSDPAIRQAGMMTEVDDRKATGKNPDVIKSNRFLGIANPFKKKTDVTERESLDD